MDWIAVFLFVGHSVNGFYTFGNPEHYQFAPATQNKCVLPQYPQNGYYMVVNEIAARPGDEFDDVSFIRYTNNRYFVLEIDYFACSRGVWSRENLKRLPSSTEHSTQTKSTEKGESPYITTNPELCKLPPYPEHGSYVVTDDAGAAPGAERQSARLEYACAAGHSRSGAARVRCENGTWDGPAPTCLPDGIEIPQNSSQVLVRFPKQNESDTCELPTAPENGYYEILQRYGVSTATNYTPLVLSYSCDVGFGIIGSRTVVCSHGVWDEPLPTCVEVCHFADTPGVSYLCKEQASDQFSKICDPYAPHGAEVLPLCVVPLYRSSQDLPLMRCVHGNWNYTPRCEPECGLQDLRRVIRQVSRNYAAGGRSAKMTELPWHVGVYDKLERPYKQICGGSIISPKLIVTAAHCFWSNVEGPRPASRFAIAAGKVYRPWNAVYDYGAQFSDVDYIAIPKRFRGVQTKFQDDIAIVYLSKPFIFSLRVWPVCIDFDVSLDQLQLTAGNLGKVAGWGLTNEDGEPSPILQVVELPNVDIGQCIDDASPDFRVYIASDKICAGYTNGTALCKGDSGGGLAFPITEGRFQRYYLRGVASTAPRNDRLCNTHAVTTFTQILPHEHFIKEHLNLTAV